MHKAIAAMPLVALVWSAAAQAGEEPLYQAVPDWVVQAELADILRKDGPAELLWH